MADPKTITGAVAGATAAAALVTGTIIYSTTGSSNSSEFIDDINGVTVEIPSVEIPKVQVITVTIPSVSYYKKNDLVQGIQIVDDSEISTINSLNVNGTNITNTNIFKFIIKNPTKDLNKQVAFQKRLNSIFKDKRSISKDYNARMNEPLIEKWIKIYQDYKNYNVSYVELTKEIRMISEAVVPRTNLELEVLTKNIQFFKSKGYNSVLFVFDGFETPENIVKTVKYIKSLGMDVYATFGGKESLESTVFIDPSLFKEDLELIAPYIDGYIIGWRRTSCHLFEMDKEYMNFIIKTLRDKNPNVPILGEIYFGNSHKNEGEGNWGFCVNIPENASGVIVNNFGYSNINKKAVIEKFIPSKVNGFKDMAKIFVIIGDVPYYASRNKNKLNFEQNFTMKEALELDFKDAGADGTLTLSNDGNEEQKYVKDGDIFQSNKLTITKYYEM